MAKRRAADTGLAGREVLLCLTGGIACYKVADLASKLTQAGAGVTVAMTEAATQFIAPLTFQTLTRRQVYTSVWQSGESYDARHVALSELADVTVVAPATADILAKMAHGIADDLVSGLALTSYAACPILVAPAMNSRMWAAPPTVANVAQLRKWGVRIVGPDEGRLACGTTGPGRMAEPPEILEAIREVLRPRPRRAGL